MPLTPVVEKCLLDHTVNGSDVLALTKGTNRDAGRPFRLGRRPSELDHVAKEIADCSEAKPLEEPDGGRVVG
jgi:hypothetical protein